jgi:hypothetical protein
VDKPTRTVDAVDAKAKVIHRSRRTRTVLVLGAVCIAGLAWWWTAPHRRDSALAQDFVRRLRESNGCSSDYANQDRVPWRALACAQRSAVMELFQQLRREVRPAHEMLICAADLDQLIGLGLGVDHDGTRSRAMLSEVLLPALETKGALPQFVRWMLDSPRLRVPNSIVPRLFELELRRIEDGRQVEIFHERSHPEQHPTLTRWAGELVANAAAAEARAFIPRLLALIRQHRSAAAGTLNTLAPFLSPNEAATALATALDIQAGFGLYGGWYLGALVERLEAAQAEALLPTFLREFERQRLAHGRDRDGASRFVAWGTLLARLADKLGPTQRTQLALSALESFAQEDDGDRLTVLVNAVLPLLRPLDRAQVAPVLHPWLEQLPSRLTQSWNSLAVFIAVGDHAATWLDKADPADVARAARGISDLLVAGRASTYEAEAFGAWAPLLTPDDAFDISRSLAQAMAKVGAGAQVDALSAAVEKLALRLSSRQLLSIAQLLAPAGHVLTRSLAKDMTEADRWLQERVAACLRTLVQRLDEPERRSFEARWGRKALWTRDAHVPSQSEQEVQRDQEVVREMADGVALPSAVDAPTAYVETLLGLWLQGARPVRRSVLICEIVRVAPGPRPLILRAHARPISAAQLYVDLLKDYRIDADDWQVLVRALHEGSQRPVGSLWDYLTWTQQAAPGRALGIDWVGNTPW